MKVGIPYNQAHLLGILKKRQDSLARAQHRDAVPASNFKALVSKSCHSSWELERSFENLNALCHSTYFPTRVAEEARRHAHRTIIDFPYLFEEE